jgi:hypothetical protein
MFLKKGGIYCQDVAYYVRPCSAREEHKVNLVHFCRHGRKEERKKQFFRDSCTRHRDI